VTGYDAWLFAGINVYSTVIFHLLFWPFFNAPLAIFVQGELKSAFKTGFMPVFLVVPDN